MSNTTHIAQAGTVIKEVESFTCLGSIIDIKGGTDSDIRARIGQAGIAFNH
jgi:hypothetical protein